VARRILFGRLGQGFIRRPIRFVVGTHGELAGGG
jgi:hypothetical protein